MSTTVTSKRVGWAATATVGLALALAGCTSATPGDDADGGEDSGAARFVACLAAAGVEAKISDQGYVVVKTGSASPDGSVSTSSEDAGPGMLQMMSDPEGSWVAAESSDYFVSDPDTQDAYGACESEHPEFSQPEYDPLNDPGMQEQLEAQAEAALTFARCARDAGFAWVADPAGEAGSTAAIALPADLTESEFRAVLEACWDPEVTAAIAWSMPDGGLSFDFSSVLEDAVGDGGASITTGEG